MLKIKTKIGASNIAGAGIGLFAAEFIKKDTIIWAYDKEIDREYSSSDFDAIVDPLSKKFLQTYCFKYDNKYYLCVDNARFFNHSVSPNCYSTDFSDSFMGYTRALRDIQEGEELTDDYGSFGLLDGDRDFNLDL